MTETRIIIDDLRESTPDQMTTMQDGIETSIDHLVADTIDGGAGFSGMAVTFSGNVVTVAPGRIYTGGKVYAFDDGLTVDLTNQGPGVLNKAIVVVGYGSEQDDDVQPVNFLVESLSTPTQPVYKAQTVATTHKRLAVVSVAVSATEAAVPAVPGYGSAVLIAQGLMTPTGIVQLVSASANTVPNLADVARRLGVVEAFDKLIGPEVSTLTAQLAGLANQTGVASLQAQTARLMLAVADLDAKSGIPATAMDAASDYLLTGDNVDLTNVIAVSLGGCKVQEGIRFPDAAASDSQLSIFSAYDPAAAPNPLKSGLLIPVYDRYLRQSTGPVTNYVLGNAYQYNPISYVQKTIARTRVRYGSEFTVCTNSAFWQSGTYDPISGIFTLPNGETFKTAAVQGYQGYSGFVAVDHTLVRVEEFWTDTVSETYWDEVVQAPTQVKGYHVAETQQIGQSQWIDAVGFYLTALDTTGDVTVVICEAADNAAPDPTSVLGLVTIPFANLVVGENVASLQVPVLLDAGKRISVVLVTTAAHKIGTTDGANFPAGTFFYLAPSGFAQGDLTKHLALNLYGCKFRAATAAIQLDNLQLAGGMTSIDILAGAVVPDSTTLTYAVSINGVMTSLSAANAGALNAGGALPPNLPLYVLMLGSPDMMPALDLSHSNAHCSRPALAFAAAYPEAPRTPPVATQNIHVIMRYEAYDSTQHSVSCKLLTGNNFATQTPPSSYTDAYTTDGALVRTYYWNLPTAVAQFKTLHQGTTSNVFDVFHIAKYQDYDS